MEQTKVLFRIQLRYLRVDNQTAEFWGVYHMRTRALSIESDVKTPSYLICIFHVLLGCEPRSQICALTAPRPY